MPVKQKSLVPGSVDPLHLELLLRFTGITGTKVIAALNAHLVDGRKQVEVCREFEVKPPLLSRKLSDLNKVSEWVKEASVFYR